MEEIIQKDTIITIDCDFTERVDAAVDSGIITTREHEEWCWTAYEEWLPRKIKFSHTRNDRKTIYLTWNFIDGVTPEHYNLTIFKKLGYKVVEPHQYEIALWESPDHLLSAGELVHKHMILKNRGAYPHKVDYQNSREWIDDVMNNILDVMDKHGIVFYQP